MRTRKGLDWTSNSAAIADAARSLEDCIIDGEVVALDHNGAPDFSALQAALSEGRSNDLIYFASISCLRTARTCGACRSPSAKSGLQHCCSARERRQQQIKYRGASGGARRRGAQVRLRLNLEGIISKARDRALSVRTHRNAG